MGWFDVWEAHNRLILLLVDKDELLSQNTIFVINWCKRSHSLLRLANYYARKLRRLSIIKSARWNTAIASKISYSWSGV